MTIAELAGRERGRARRRRWAQEGAPEPRVELDRSQRLLAHGLGRLLPRWGELPHRGALERDPSFREHRADVHALLRDHQWDMRAATASSTARPGCLRAVAWNLERGKRWSALCGLLDEHPDLRELDLLLLTEVDHGMGRSENRHVAVELAARLGMGYVFSPSHLVLSAGDCAEQDHDRPNTLAMHGVALLSRFPVRGVRGVGLPEFADKLGAVERRLGATRALVAEIEAPGAPLTAVVVHLDPFAPPAHRARQMRHLLAATRGFDPRHVLLGGDLNTNTYHLGSPVGLAVDVMHKLVRFGFAGTVAQYMIPGQVFERATFDALAEAGLRTEGFVDPQRATIRFDLNDPEILDKAQRALPGPVFRYLQRRLAPWGGAVPLRMDWFAGRGVEPRAAWTVSRPRFRGSHASDHDPIGVELDWPPRPPSPAGARTG